MSAPDLAAEQTLKQVKHDNALALDQISFSRSHFCGYIEMKDNIEHTITPRYGDALKEDQEQQTHPTGGVVVEQFEHIDSTLVTNNNNNKKEILEKAKHRKKLIY